MLLGIDNNVHKLHKTWNTIIPTLQFSVEINTTTDPLKWQKLQAIPVCLGVQTHQWPQFCSN